MGKIYKDKKSKGCALCKTHKHGWASEAIPILEGAFMWLTYRYHYQKPDASIIFRLTQEQYQGRKDLLWKKS